VLVEAENVVEPVLLVVLEALDVVLRLVDEDVGMVTEDVEEDA